MQTTTAQTFRLLGKEPHIISLMLLSAFAAMGAILMTPAIPEIAQYFHTTVGLTQLTVTSFLLGYAGGQLIYGPIANRFGRKPAFFTGIAIATLGSLFSILSSPVESFHLLILGRFLEALGASAGLVVCFTVINDFYFPDQARRITALLMLAFAIVPGVAIAIGGILTQYINWQACFYFLLLYGLILIYPAYRLPETIITRDHKALHYQYMFKNYGKMFLNKKLIGFALLSGFSSACIYVFGAEGPFIGIHLLHIPPATYGLLGLLPFVGTFIGSLIVIRLTRLNPIVVLKIAFILELIAALSMFIFFVFHWVTLFTLLIPMGLLCMGHPIMAGTALTLAMQQTEDKGNGSAVMNFTGGSMPVLMTFLLGMLHIGEAWIMPLIFLISLFFMVCVSVLLLRRKATT
jgi:Bcr/CflA subfamily drug resistance transporter